MPEPQRPEDRMNWKWTLAMGIVLIVGGFVALTNAFLASLAVVAFASVFFLIAGAMQLWLAFRGEDGATGARLIAGILGVLLIVFAFSLYFQPFAGLLSLTILAASFFLAAGVVRVILALRMRHRRAWGWLLASGLVSVGLGLFIFIALPEAALTILGVFLGVELLFSGAAALTLALGSRDT